MTAVSRIRVLVAAVAVLVLAGTAGAWALSTGPAPRAMVGTWTRYVGPAAYDRFATPVGTTGTWKIAITKSGAITVTALKTSKALKGTLTVTGTKVTFAVGCKTANSY